MSFQEQVDQIAVKLTAVSAQLAKGFDEVHGKISELEEKVASGETVDFSAVNAALDSVAAQAESLDSIVPDVVAEDPVVEPVEEPVEEPVVVEPEVVVEEPVSGSPGEA